MATSLVGRRLLQNICKLHVSTRLAKFSHNNVRTFCVSTRLLATKYFTEKHEWVSVDGDIGTVGISDYAQDKLGEVVYAQVPEVGRDLVMDEEAGVLESVKAASEVFCPVSGKVIESNSMVEEAPTLINNSCYEDGWLFKLKLADEKELSLLMKEDEYIKFIENLE